MYHVINVLVENIFTYLPCTHSLSPRLPVKGLGVFMQKFMQCCFDYLNTSIVVFLSHYAVVIMYSVS